MLELRNVAKVVGGLAHINDVSLTLQHGSRIMVGDKLMRIELPGGAAELPA